jgi:hypothetical protein
VRLEKELKSEGCECRVFLCGYFGLLVHPYSSKFETDYT